MAVSPQGKDTIRIGNKGQVFSLITLLMSALFILLFGTIASTGITNQADVSEAQAVVIDSFVGNIDFYVENMIAQSGYPILEATVQNFDTVFPNTYTDYETIFEECMLSGSYTDTSQTPTVVKNCDIGAADNSLPSNLNTLFTQVENAYDATIAYTIIDIQTSQSDAYIYNVNLTMEVSLTRSGIVWQDILNISKDLDLIEVFNPVTFGQAYNHRYRYNPGRDLTRVTNIDGNLTLIEEYIDNSYYFRDSKATSFTDRLEGTYVAGFDNVNPFGITTIYDQNAYVGSDRPHVSFLYEAGASFNCDDLVRIDDSSLPGVTIDDDILFPESYAVNDMGIAPGNLLEVCGCCDAVGCTDACG